MSGDRAIKKSEVDEDAQVDAVATVENPKPAPADPAPSVKDERNAQVAKRLDRAAAELADLGRPVDDGSAAKRNRLLDIPFSVQVMVGRANVSVAKLLDMKPSDLLTLDKDIHKPLDVLVNGRVFARGELALLDDQPDRLGIRIVEIVGEDR